MTKPVYQCLSLRGSKPKFWYNFSLGITLIDPIIERQALYWIGKIVKELWKERIVEIFAV